MFILINKASSSILVEDFSLEWSQDTWKKNVKKKTRGEEDRTWISETHPPLQ